jgi:hypothetical protein
MAVSLAALAGASAAEAPVWRSLPLVFSYPAPPAGFRPLTASPADLARYGLPPRPVASTHAALPLATWSRAMASAHFAVTPKVARTGRQHIRAIVVTATKVHRAGLMESTNWAGQTLINPVASFGSGSYAEVLAEWQIPAVQDAIGTCGSTAVSSIWVGVDGSSNSNDVMQAGTEADVTCRGGINYANYYPWFEWYPADEYEITNFPVAPGEAVLVVVQATSATTANATFVDLQSNQYTVVGFSAPAGTTLKGDSAEWIVERPTVNKVLGNLADYGMVWMSSEVAFLDSELNSGSYDVAGTGGPGRTPYSLTMVDSSGNALAYTNLEGTSAQVLAVTGSAY